jgi:hypothetical protein
MFLQPRSRYAVQFLIDPYGNHFRSVCSTLDHRILLVRWTATDARQEQAQAEVDRILADVNRGLLDRGFGLMGGRFLAPKDDADPSLQLVQ